ncbi:RNA polymerase, sigma subunit, ECF family [Fodinibius roseus]|uniref:RNA polymerase, sigma subunit, ECF family n=1 Tax=Fodinibius roseus TaxID=1194090 RepID=A0A1M5EIQ5_9BACT|nr:RNA polymerase sigma factor [Fodinibius roseus]SHF79148.1 RNA polymerase, sigma subunit, ECF family [Fodinibius roseus]
MTDAKLIENFRKGDTAAFNRLVERWQQRIHRLAYRYFASHDEAMEITQKTFIRVYHKLNTLDDTEQFNAWIYRIANNLCLDETKRAGRRRSSPMEALGKPPVAKGLASNPDRQVEKNELGSILQLALNQLPPEQRIVVIMKEYEGLKFREIAEILEEPENTVKSRLYYGLTKLRQLFNQWNIESEALRYE